MRSPRPPGCLLVALVIGFGCSNTKAPAPNDHTVDKVVVVVMENYGYNDVIGSSETPYLNRTILHGSISLTNMDAETHPSLPNYAYLVAGTICGSNDDADWDLTCRTLFDQLTDAGVDWRTYAEGYPGDASTCDLTPSTEGESSNDYARKHVPQLLFSSTSSGTPCTKHMANFPGDTPADDAPPTANFAGASFPPVSFVIPNLCHDMHDSTDECGAARGGLSGGDEWLRKNWSDLVQAAGERGAVILTWDESDGDDPSIATLIGGEELAGVGTTNGDAFDHGSILRAIEDAFGLPCLEAACDAKPIPLEVRGS